MGNKLFGIDIAALVAKEFKGKLLKATLTKRTPGTRTPGQLTAGTNPTSVVYPDIDGIVSDYKETQLQDGVIKRGDRQVLLIGDSLPSGVIPEENDLVEIEGTTYYVVDVVRDPAAATYQLQVRGS